MKNHFDKTLESIDKICYTLAKKYSENLNMDYESLLPDIQIKSLKYFKSALFNYNCMRTIETIDNNGNKKIIHEIDTEKVTKDNSNKIFTRVYNLLSHWIISYLIPDLIKFDTIESDNEFLLEKYAYEIDTAYIDLTKKLDSLSKQDKQVLDFIFNLNELQTRKLLNCDQKINLLCQSISKRKKTLTVEQVLFSLSNIRKALNISINDFDNVYQSAMDKYWDSTLNGYRIPKNKQVDEIRQPEKSTWKIRIKPFDNKPKEFDIIENFNRTVRNIVGVTCEKHYRKQDSYKNSFHYKGVYNGYGYTIVDKMF